MLKFNLLSFQLVHWREGISRKYDAVLKSLIYSWHKSYIFVICIGRRVQIHCSFLLKQWCRSLQQRLKVK